MLLIIYSGNDSRWVPELLDRHHVDGYTEMAQAHGAGQSGKRAGTRAWPGETSVYFSVIPTARAEELAAALRERKSGMAPGERLHVAVIPTENFF